MSELVLDVRQSTNDVIWHRHRSLTLFLIILTLGIYGALLYGEIQYGHLATATPDELKGVVFLFILPALILAIPYAAIRSRMRSLFFTELASALGFAYAPRGDATGLSGRFFSFGNEKSVSDVLSGAYQGLPIRLFNYVYVTGYGKNSRNHPYIVGELSVSGTLPELLIKPKGVFDFMSAAGLGSWQPPGTQELSLEGDFSKHLTAYVAQGAQIEGLEILEPDVMAAIMDGYESFYIECAGPKVYVFKPGSLAENRTDLLGLLTLLERFYAKLAPELRDVQS